MARAVVVGPDAHSNRLQSPIFVIEHWQSPPPAGSYPLVLIGCFRRSATGNPFHEDKEAELGGPVQTVNEPVLGELLNYGFPSHRPADLQTFSIGTLIYPSSLYAVKGFVSTDRE